MANFSDCALAKDIPIYNGNHISVHVKRIQINYSKFEQITEYVPFVSVYKITKNRNHTIKGIDL